MEPLVLDVGPMPMTARGNFQLPHILFECWMDERVKSTGQTAIGERNIWAVRKRGDLS